MKARTIGFEPITLTLSAYCVSPSFPFIYPYPLRSFGNLIDTDGYFQLIGLGVLQLTRMFTNCIMPLNNSKVNK